MTEAQKREIAGMTRMEMARRWRFGKVGDPLLAGDTGDYFVRVFFGQRGGFSPGISKALGLGERR